MYQFTPADLTIGAVVVGGICYLIGQRVRKVADLNTPRYRRGVVAVDRRFVPDDGEDRPETPYEPRRHRMDPDAEPDVDTADPVDHVEGPRRRFAQLPPSAAAVLRGEARVVAGMASDLRVATGEIAAVVMAPAWIAAIRDQHAVNAEFAAMTAGLDDPPLFADTTAALVMPTRDWLILGRPSEHQPAPASALAVMQQIHAAAAKAGAR